MNYKICVRCVMDSSDSLIFFDKNGVCNHCHDWEKQWTAKLGLEKQWPNEFLKMIKRHSGDKYDAVLGLSGGVDSSYAYHLAKELGLRIYAIHFDNGYDLPKYADNPSRLVKYWGDELHAIKVDDEEFRRLQIAFLKSGTTGLEIPTDHAIKAVTYQSARQEGIHNILNGTNIVTESHGTPAWTMGHADWRYIKSVAEAFGVSLRNFPHYTIWDWMTWMQEYNWINILDYTYYNREMATQLLEAKYGYKRYGGKHQESRVTRFHHGYIIPRRFGFDTRRSRLSSMIASNQITRDEALSILSRPAYDPAEMEEDKQIICEKIGITIEEFEGCMKLPLKTFYDYPSYTPKNKLLYRVARYIFHMFR